MSEKNILYRYSEVEENQTDGERILQLAFSSEFPVKRKAGKLEADLGVAKEGEEYLELLSHEDGHYDLSALNNNGALLDEHDKSQQIGKVNRAEVSTDKIGRAVVEFDGVTDLSKTRYTQMQKRSRPHVSFGYEQTKFIREEQLPDGRTAKRVAWAADEISSVARPADPTVGARRSALDTCHCTRCGNSFLEQDLDKDFRCDTCGPVSRSLMNAKFTRDAQDKVTVQELGNQVAEAVQKDERFTGKNNKGEPTGWCSVRDLFYDEEIKQWSALIYCSTDGKLYEVDFEPVDNVVRLDGEVEVQEKSVYEEVAQRSSKKSFKREKEELENKPDAEEQALDDEECEFEDGRCKRCGY